MEHKPFRIDSTIRADSKVWYAELEMEWINNQFGKDLKQLFIDNLTSHEAIIKRHRQKKVFLIDFEEIRIYKYLGAGSYGAVHLVQNIKDGHMLALKSISKKLINNQTVLQLLKNEKEILSFVEFPLVINMEGMNKEEKYINFFIEFVDGLPFDDVLMKLDTLSEWQTCFYTSQVILMLDYLHCHGIVYRDLKAQNIICSTDVGIVSFLGISKACRSWNSQVPQPIIRWLLRANLHCSGNSTLHCARDHSAEGIFLPS